MAINAAEFNAALEAIEVAKGISKETAIAALEEALIKGFKKQLGGDDALVKLVFDPTQGILEMYQIKNVVKEVEDDFLEISEEDAKKIDKKYKAGDEYLIPANVDDLRKATAMSIKAIFKQKFAEAEKEVLYKTFEDKIDTIITGSVEKFDERGCSVNIGRTSIYLPKKEMIGDEKYNPGDMIKLYVNDVATGNKGAHIVVTRAGEGFLKCLMHEEIHEIYDGTIIIKGIAREAGERSKVAVYSNDPNVDPAGACIGPNGSRIQKIVGQLGNGQSKEKIDIIAFSDNAGLFIMEALKPARVVGIALDEENKSATVVVKDDSLSLAIGRKGVNARLAVRLTGFSIDIKTETDALEEGFAFKSFEELQAEETEIKAKKALEAQKALYEKTISASEVLPGLPQGYVAPQARVYEEETNDVDESLREQAENEEPISSPTPTVSVEPTPVTTEEVQVKEEVKTTNVKTTTTLEDLEKSLAAESKKQSSGKSYRKKKKEVEEEVEEEKSNTASDPSKYMSIYTEEELKAMEEEDKDVEEEAIEEDEDIDYDEFDSYYDKK